MSQRRIERPGTEVPADLTSPSTLELPLQRPRTWKRAVLQGCALGLCLALGVEAGCVWFGRNLHAVVPGRVYRSAQLSPNALALVIRTLGIRTVLNLRGCCDPWPWYLNECRTTHNYDVAQEDIGMSAGRLPPVNELRYLIEVLDRTDYPILIHCKRGADRTGLVSALVLLLQDDVDFAQARQQLGLRYGHLPVGRTTYLDQFLDLYADWLHAQDLVHSPAALRRWIEHEYCPGVCRSQLQLVDAPTYLPRGQPALVKVRAHNTSVQPWRLRPGTNAGIHACFFLWDPADNCIALGRAGLFNAEVMPGQSIDLGLVLPAIPAAGRYRLLVDMVDEQQCEFFKTGSEPLETELEVR
jgi:hypothetical protein